MDFMLLLDLQRLVAGSLMIGNGASTKVLQGREVNGGVA